MTREILNPKTTIKEEKRAQRQKTGISAISEDLTAEKSVTPETPAGLDTLPGVENDPLYASAWLNTYYQALTELEAIDEPESEGQQKTFLWKVKDKQISWTRAAACLIIDHGGKSFLVKDHADNYLTDDDVRHLIENDFNPSTASITLALAITQDHVIYNQQHGLKTDDAIVTLPLILNAIKNAKAKEAVKTKLTGFANQVSLKAGIPPQLPEILGPHYEEFLNRVYGQDPLAAAVKLYKDPISAETKIPLTLAILWYLNQYHLLPEKYRQSGLSENEVNKLSKTPKIKSFLPNFWLASAIVNTVHYSRQKDQIIVTGEDMGLSEKGKLQIPAKETATTQDIIKIYLYEMATQYNLICENWKLLTEEYFRPISTSKTELEQSIGSIPENDKYPERPSGYY